MNGFTIFQTKEETERAIVVHQNAQICDVRLARAKVAADHLGNDADDPISVSMGVKSKQVDGPAGQLLIEVTFRLAGSRKRDQARNRTVICVECTFEVNYQLRPEFTLTSENVKAFKDGNAIFNCWPYCRHFVQEMIQRMGYPTLILPFLRVQTKQREGRKLLAPRN